MPHSRGGGVRQMCGFSLRFSYTGRATFVMVERRASLARTLFVCPGTRRRGAEEGSFCPVRHERTAGEPARGILRSIEERRQDKTGSGALRGGEGGGGRVEWDGLSTPRRVGSRAKPQDPRCDVHPLFARPRRSVARRWGSFGLVLVFSAEERLRGERGEREARVREAWSSDEGLASVLAVGRAHCIASASASAAEPGHKTKLFMLRAGPCSGADTWHMSRPCIRWVHGAGDDARQEKEEVLGVLPAPCANECDSDLSRCDGRPRDKSPADEGVDDRSSIVFCAIEEHRRVGEGRCVAVSKLGVSKFRPPEEEEVESLLVTDWCQIRASNPGCVLYSLHCKRLKLYSGLCVSGLCMISTGDILSSTTTVNTSRAQCTQFVHERLVGPAFPCYKLERH
ncbi:hypothetical protein K438DRAFT_1767148 [Mycena galopus ATCC 62051]|nr:hypothetical protein K438DRAFT_1767148 [Mycena galopus ATCC 62051]